MSTLIVLCLLITPIVYFVVFLKKDKFKAGDVICFTCEPWEDQAVYQIEMVGIDKYKVIGLTPNATHYTLHKVFAHDSCKLYKGPRDQLEFK